MVTDCLIQQLNIRMQGGFMAILLETGPAHFIQGVLMEGRVRALLKYRLVGVLGLVVLSANEQVLAASELGFIILGAGGELLRIGS